MAIWNRRTLGLVLILVLTLGLVVYLAFYAFGVAGDGSGKGQLGPVFTTTTSK